MTVSRSNGEIKIGVDTDDSFTLPADICRVLAGTPLDIYDPVRKQSAKVELADPSLLLPLSNLDDGFLQQLKDDQKLLGNGKALAINVGGGLYPITIKRAVENAGILRLLSRAR